MGEYWKIVDLDGREVYSMPFQGLKLIEFFWSQEVGEMLDLLLVSPTAFAGWVEDVWPVPEEGAAQRALRPQSSKLLALSNELLREIFKWIDSLLDAVFLCITNNSLAAAGAFRVRQLLDHEVSPWAGHRLICIGDSLDDASELPEPIADLVAKQMADAARDGGLYAFASKTYTKRRAEFGRWDSAVAALDAGAADARMGAGERRRLDAFLAHLDALAPRMGRRSVGGAALLCNVSAGEYVRGRALRERYGDGADGDDADGPALGHLLLGQICWSDEGDFHFKDAGYDMMHGQWAGDEFEVTTADRLRPDIEWEDVTESVLETFDGLWEGTDH